MKNRVNAKVFAKVGRKTWQSLPDYTSLGCYTLVYSAKDGATFCAACARSSDTGERIIDADVYWEGETLTCEHCGCDIEPSYPTEKEESS